MGLEKIGSFSKDDLARHRQFRVLIENGSFEIKGNAAIQVANLLMWFNGLESKIERIVNKKNPPVIKPIEVEKES